MEALGVASNGVLEDPQAVVGSVRAGGTARADGMTNGDGWNPRVVKPG